jgi:hypothetical protein
MAEKQTKEQKLLLELVADLKSVMEDRMEAVTANGRQVEELFESLEETIKGE